MCGIRRLAARSPVSWTQLSIMCLSVTMSLLSQFTYPGVRWCKRCKMLCERLFYFFVLCYLKLNWNLNKVLLRERPSERVYFLLRVLTKKRKEKRFLFFLQAGNGFKPKYVWYDLKEDPCSPWLNVLRQQNVWTTDFWSTISLFIFSYKLNLCVSWDMYIYISNFSSSKC